MAWRFSHKNTLLLNQLNYSLPFIISPTGYVSKHAKIGEGTIVMHNTIVNANARIGKNCIINNKSLIKRANYILDKGTNRKQFINNIKKARNLTFLPYIKRKLKF